MLILVKLAIIYEAEVSASVKVKFMQHGLGLDGRNFYLNDILCAQGSFQVLQ